MKLHFFWKILILVLFGMNIALLFFFRYELKSYHKEQSNNMNELVDIHTMQNKEIQELKSQVLNLEEEVKRLQAVPNKKKKSYKKKILQVSSKTFK